MKPFRGYLQGYNAQAAVNEHHIVLAAEITTESGDFSYLQPMVDAMLKELERAGIPETPQVALADAGYWNEQHMDYVTGEHRIPVLIPPDSSDHHYSQWRGEPRHRQMRPGGDGRTGSELTRAARTTRFG